MATCVNQLHLASLAICKPTCTLCFLPVFCVGFFPPGVQTQGFFPRPMKGHHGFKFHPYWPPAPYHFHMYLPHPIATATRYAHAYAPYCRVPRACTASPKCILTAPSTALWPVALGGTLRVVLQQSSSVGQHSQTWQPIQGASVSSPSQANSLHVNGSTTTRSMQAHCRS